MKNQQSAVVDEFHTFYFNYVTVIADRNRVRRVDRVEESIESFESSDSLCDGDPTRAIGKLAIFILHSSLANVQFESLF